MRPIRLMLVGLLVGAAVVTTSPTQATGAPAVVAVPGSFMAGYATTAVEITKGSQLSFVNGDLPLVPHTVTSDVAGKFQTATIGGGQTTSVTGASALAKGSYGFHCVLHPNMKGTLTVV